MASVVFNTDSESNTSCIDIGNLCYVLSKRLFSSCFYSVRCGHCKKLAPTWEEFAQKLSHDGKIKIAHVDCTLEENKDLCNDQEVITQVK